MRKAIALLLVAVLSTLAVARPSMPPATATQEAASPSELTNKDVLAMLRSGLSAEIVVAKIKTSPGKFDTSSAALTELKSFNVPDPVILAMVEKSTVTPQPNSVFTGPPVDVKVPDGTEIEIQLTNTLSGKTAKIGDVVDFTVLRPVEKDGVTIFERNASGRARVTTAKKSGRWGRAGKLEWAMQDIQAIDGNRVPARFTKRELGDSKGGTVAVAAVATTVLLGPLGLLWGLKKGQQAIIPAGNRYSVFVHGDTTIKGRAAANAQ
jgi:hypothetical protein